MFDCFPTLLGSWVHAPFIQFAASKLLPDTEDSGLPKLLDLGPISGLELFLVKVVNFALFFLGIITLLAIFYGGYMALTSAGNEEQYKKGVKILTGSIIGFIIILLSYAAVSTLITSTSPLS